MLYFFYGTLIDGSDNPVSGRIHARLRPLGPATVRGRLFAIPTPQGWYPALLADAAGKAVHGMIYATLPEWTAEDLALLDAYEVYYPDRPDDSEYLRRPIAVSRDNGPPEWAEAYIYHAALPQGAVPVDHGDFRAFLADGGLPAYRTAQ